MERLLSGLNCAELSDGAPPSFQSGKYTAICIEYKKMSIACVEFKTVVSSLDLDTHLSDVSNEMQMMHLSSTQFTWYITKEHVTQLSHLIAVA